MMIVPLIKEYLDVGVRNDEQLVKLAAIVQRMVSNTAGPDGESGSLMLTEEEKKQLMAQVESTITEMQSTVNTEKVEKLKEQS